jgi:MOSC domain-containing protein YiiM
MTAPQLLGLADPCDVCRFDGTHYSDFEIDGTLRSLPYRWKWLVEGLPSGVLHARPHGASASVDELADASAAAVARLVGDDGHADRRARLDAAHAGGHALHLAGRVLAAQASLHGRDVERHGTVSGLFVSNGGVPKLPIDVARIGYRGVDGDRQASRKHHGRVWQALCLYSADVVDALASEGHPIAPGRTGENVSIRGLDWADVRPGVQLRIGEVLAEVSAYATPCAKNAGWFADRDFRRIEHDGHPGWSRAYASVLEDGTVHLGDHVTLEP